MLWSYMKINQSVLAPIGVLFVKRPC
jgi:hypothetical protein